MGCSGSKSIQLLHNTFSESQDSTKTTEHDCPAESQILTQSPDCIQVTEQKIGIPELSDEQMEDIMNTDKAYIALKNEVSENESILTVEKYEETAPLMNEAADTECLHSGEVLERLEKWHVLNGIKPMLNISVVESDEELAETEGIYGNCEEDNLKKENDVIVNKEIHIANNGSNIVNIENDIVNNEDTIGSKGNAIVNHDNGYIIENKKNEVDNQENMVNVLDHENYLANTKNSLTNNETVVTNVNKLISNESSCIKKESNIVTSRNNIVNNRPIHHIVDVTNAENVLSSYLSNANSNDLNFSAHCNKLQTVNIPASNNHSNYEESVKPKTDDQLSSKSTFLLEHGLSENVGEHMETFFLSNDENVEEHSRKNNTFVKESQECAPMSNEFEHKDFLRKNSFKCLSLSDTNQTHVLIDAAKNLKLSHDPVLMRTFTKSTCSVLHCVLPDNMDIKNLCSDGSLAENTQSVCNSSFINNGEITAKKEHLIITNNIGVQQINLNLESCNEPTCSHPSPTMEKMIASEQFDKINKQTNQAQNTTVELMTGANLNRCKLNSNPDECRCHSIKDELISGVSQECLIDVQDISSEKTYILEKLD